MEEKKLDKDINVRSKLTDEEILELLKLCAKDLSYFERCTKCTLNGMNGCTTFLMESIVELIHRLQDENKRLIEELKEEKIWFSELLQTKNELQEQVDELKGQNEWLTNEKTYLKQCADAFLGDYKNSVKDTAKEILQELYDEIDENTPKWVGVQIKIIAKRYGV